MLRPTKKSSAEAGEAIRAARASAINALVQPLNIGVAYFQTFLNFMVSSWTWFGFVFALLLLGFLLVNFQQETIVFLDNTWEDMFPVIIFPLKFCISLVSLFLQIAVGILNFVSQVSSTVVVDTVRRLIDCPGYFSSFFQNLVQIALFIESSVMSIVNFLLTTMTNGSSNPVFVEIDVRTPFSYLRQAFYDIALRVQCTCPAERGLTDVVITGLLDSTSTSVDDVIHYGLNSALSVPMVVVNTIVAISNTGAYTPPNTDTVINLTVGFVTALQTVLNQLTSNAVAFVEALLTLSFDFGTPLAGTAPWKMVPVWSIPGRTAVLTLEIVRILARSVVNAPRFFITSGASSGHVSLAYQLLDTTGVYQAALNLTDASFGQVLGGLHHTINATGYAIAAWSEVPFAYTQFSSQAIQRLLLGRDDTNFTRFVAPFTGNCLLDQTIMYPAGFRNFWSAIYDVVGEYNSLVTTAWGKAADAFNNAMGPYYPPLGETVALGVIAGANYASAQMSKFIYFLNAIMQLQPPSAVCMSSLDRSVRVSVMNLVDSLGDLISFFLDIKGAQEIRNAHFNCMETHVANYMLLGSLKVNYFAAKMCNTRYIDNSLVECTFGQNSSCPSYILPYHDLQVNLLCASEDVITTALRYAVEQYFLAADFSQANFVTSVACFIAPTNTATCPQNSGTGLKQAVADAALNGCNAYKATVQIGNVLASLLSLGYSFAYSEGYSGMGFGPGQTQRGTTKSFNNLDITGPDVAAFFASRHAGN